MVDTGIVVDLDHIPLPLTLLDIHPVETVADLVEAVFNVDDFEDFVQELRPPQPDIE